VKILVVDDEALARERLLRLLAELRPEADCREAAGGAEALRQVQQDNPDLVLLDIRMPGTDGIEVARALGAMDHPPAVIFCTAYDEYAMAALQHQAVAYLLKPVRPADMEHALAVAGRVNRLQLAALEESRLSDSAGKGRTAVSSHTHRGLETMAVADIRCFLAEQKYVTAHSPAGELMLSETLKDLEGEFGDRFLRVHRNALVGLAHIIRLERDPREGWRVVLEGVDARPAVSRRHLADVKQRLLEG
jgi:two-component system response regulator AlgR